MELMISFHDEVNDVKYVLYKRPESVDECFAAKYVQNGDDLELDTNLNVDEIKMLNVVLMENAK